MNIAVYLGSHAGDSPAYTNNARALGMWIGSSGHTLVYGGTTAGLMGVLADSALEAGGKVIGVLPNVPLIMDQKHPGLSEYICSDDVADRRSRMIELADAFVALPGGLGTLDEITEVLSLVSLDLVRQPIVFFGAESYFEPFKVLFEHMIAKGFSSRGYFRNVCFTEDIGKLAAFLEGHNINANYS